MPTQQRVAVMASTFAAGTVVASTALLGGVPMAPLHTDGFFNQAHRDITLTATDAAPDTSTFAGSLEWLMDDALGIGKKTLPDLIGGTQTVDHLLSGSGLSVDSTMTDVFDKLGFENFTVGQMMTLAGLPATDTMDDLLTHLGMGSTTMSGLMESMLGIGAGTHLVTLVDDLGLGGTTVDQLMTMVGFPGTTTVDTLLGDLGLGNLEGLLTVTGITSTTTLSDLIGVLGSNAGALTLDDLLNTAPTSGAVTGDGFLSSMNMTLGQLLGFTSQTTVTSIIDGLHFPTPSGGTITMGDETLATILGLVKVTPSMSIATLLGDLPFGTSGSSDFGGDSLGDLLGVMANGHAVTDTTTMADLLTDMGMGSLTLDQWIGLP